MTLVNDALILKVADLARLELNPKEIQDYVHSIGEILKHVEHLKDVNVQGVEPLYYGIDDDLRLREDRVEETPPAPGGSPKVLISAPDVLHGGYKVPQIIG